MSREETPPSLYSLCTIPLAAPHHFTHRPALLHPTALPLLYPKLHHFIYSDAPILPYFSLISAEEPSHRSAPSRHFSIAMRPSSPVFPLFLLRNRPTPVYLCADFSAPPRHFIYSGAPIPPPTFPLFLLRKRPTAAHLSPHFSASAHSLLRTFVLVSTKGEEWLYDGNGAFLPY